MPSTKLKNLAYRMLLPLRSPSPDANPVRAFIGEPIRDQQGLVRMLKKHRVMGGALLISAGDRSSLVLTGCESTEQTAKEDTLFRVASITKMAAAMVTLRLCDEQLLDLNTPVAEYLPDGDKLMELEGVTLTHLLSHTSGLSDPPELVNMLENGDPYPDAVSGSRFAEPGTAFRYSNMGFGLIGCILESVSGMPLGRLFDEKLFYPLEMNASLEACSLPEEKIMPVIRLMPYRPGHEVIVTKMGSRPLSTPDPLRHFGHTAGSMYTDIHSLYRMIACIRDGGKPILSRSMTDLMIKQHASYGSMSPTLSYGLGMLMIRDGALSSGRIIGHQGYAYGCADGAFWEESTGHIMIMLNGGCSEARTGRLGLCNRDLLRWAYRKELPSWTGS